MISTAIQGTPITIDLTQLALSSGWTISGNIATHDSCNVGNLYLLNNPIVSGKSYIYTYQILSIGSGYVQAFLGLQGGAQYTTPQIVTETVVANGTQFSFYATGNCSITLFSIGLAPQVQSQTAINTLSYSERIRASHNTNKWMFYSYIPDNAFSIYTNTYSFNYGQPYLHLQGSNSRCNFYGVQFPAIVNISSTEQPTRVKTFLSFNYQSNQLLTSPSIATSLGQNSVLFSDNFLYATYNNGLKVYNNEGLYKASFLRDLNVDLYNGSQLKGNWMTLQLQATTPSLPLQLYTTEIEYNHSSQGIR